MSRKESTRDVDALTEDGRIRALTDDEFNAGFDLDRERSSNADRVWAYATAAGPIKVILGHPVLGAIGVEWALQPDAARKLRDYLTAALEVTDDQ